MRTAFILFGFVLLSMASEARTRPLEYVITNSDTLICHRMVVQNHFVKCTLNTGLVVKIPHSDIVAYQHYGQLMERKPVYVQGKISDKTIFMQLIDVDNGIKIYRYNQENFFKGEVYPVVCLYKDGQFLEQKENPDVTDIYDFVHHYNDSTLLLLSGE